LLVTIVTQFVADSGSVHRYHQRSLPPFALPPLLLLVVVALLLVAFSLLLKEVAGGG
jgi:hypothetical protein